MLLIYYMDSTTNGSLLLYVNLDQRASNRVPAAIACTCCTVQHACYLRTAEYSPFFQRNYNLCLPERIVGMLRTHCRILSGLILIYNPVANEPRTVSRCPRYPYGNNVYTKQNFHAVRTIKNSTARFISSTKLS